jgi:hypothetical protein
MSLFIDLLFSGTLVIPFILSAALRCACSLVLESRWGEVLCLLGIACNTWISMSRGSTCRDVFAAMGHPHSLAVYRANKAVARKGFGRGDNVQGVYEIKIT